MNDANHAPCVEHGGKHCDRCEQTWPCRTHLVDQLAFLRGWYGSINAREDNPKVGELLDMLDRAVGGHDVRQEILDASRRFGEHDG